MVQPQHLHMVPLTMMMMLIIIIIGKGYFSVNPISNFASL